jgi:PAS domain-containing protein
MGTKTSATNQKRVAKHKLQARAQYSVRLPEHISQPLRGIVDETGLSINEQIVRIMEKGLLIHHQPQKRFAKTPPQRISATQSAGLAPADRRLFRCVQYFYSIPCPAMISDLEGKFQYVNDAFERLVGNKIDRDSRPEMFWEEVPLLNWIVQHDADVRLYQQPIFCLERIQLQHDNPEKLVIRFPIFERPRKREDLKGIAAIFFDLKELREAAVLKPEKETSRLQTDGMPRYVENPDDEAMHALKSFVYNVPAIATIKSSTTGVLLCVNDQYEKVTGKKREDVEGKRPWENWPAATARMISDHDLVVRETSAPFLSVEILEMDSDEKKERLNLRFPIFGATGEIEMTGTLGFDYTLLRQAVEKLVPQSNIERPAIETVYSFAPDIPDSLRSRDSRASYNELSVARH